MPAPATTDDDWLHALFDSPPDGAWILSEDGYDPLTERDRESRLAIGNGLIGARGSLGLPTRASRPRTYVAGLYDAPGGTSGSDILIPVPDWLRLVVSVDGEELHAGKHQTFSRILDMTTGILRSDSLHELPFRNNVKLSSLRLLSQHDRTAGLQVVRLAVEKSAGVTLTAHLVPISLALILEDADGIASVWRTGSGSRVRVTMEATLSLPDGPVPAQLDRPLARRWNWEARPGQLATMVRTVTVTRLDGRGEQWRTRSSAGTADDARETVGANNAAWADRWHGAAIDVEGDEDANRALHYAAYQLLSAANPDDERTSVGARGLTGDAYSGHIFWDTEIFLLPFYTLCWPQAARTMLMYRYHTLPAARAKATRLGYRGALYAWESTDTGDDMTPEFAHLPNGETMRVLCGLIEHHISADIAFAVQRYWDATGDDAFIGEAGAEILLETARFWASRAVLEADGRYHIRDVIGPDEYHEHVDDNAYTNGMAQWNLEAGLNVARFVDSSSPDRWKELRAALNLNDDEMEHWADVAKRMYTGFDAASGLFEQFQGFFGLEPIDLSSYEPRNMPIDMLLGRDRTQRSQAIKQADVVMLTALLSDRITTDVCSKNFRYYEPRCGHGSSLSPGVHALVAANLGDVTLAETYFRETMSIDLGDTMGNLAGGVHMAALGSLWQVAVFGFAGLSLRPDGVAFTPRLPHRWESLSFTIRWRGTQLRIAISPLTLEARILQGAPVTVDVNGVARGLREGQEQSWPLPASIAEAEAAS